MEKLVGENDYLKQLIAGVERRVDEEVQKRVREEFESRRTLEQKLVVFKEEIRNDEK